LFKDDEDHEVIVKHTISLPPWVTFSSSSYLFNPTTLDSIVVEGYLGDEVSMGDSFSFRLDVFNDAPFFTSPL
jgi:hypothetical protein